MLHLYLTYSPSYKLTPPNSRVLFGQHLILDHWRHQSALTRLENVRQLNVRRGKKLGFQLSHRQPHDEESGYSK